MRPGYLTGGQLLDQPAIQPDLAGAGADQPRQAAQQGRLAAAVGTDDDGEAAIGQLHVEIAADRLAAVAHGEAMGGEAAGGSVLAHEVRRHSRLSRKIR
ncbi:hypothetical protein Q3H58_004586 [Pseudomonas psychrotolerans]|nr:hypothetical protein [Pseudomonas psychrotolerans]